MALKTVLDNVDSLAPDVRKEYVQKEGKWHLAIDGEVPGMYTKVQYDEQVNKLAEFRDNNRGLNTKVTELEGKLKTFEGVDPAEYKTLKTRLENAGAKDGDVGKLVAEAVKAALDPVNTELAALKASDKQKTVDLAMKTFEGTLKDAGIKAGVDEKMLPHFVDAGLKTFKLEDGKFVPKKVSSTGDVVPFFSVKKAGEPITPEEWAELQITEAPGFFKQSGGGGADNKNKGGKVDSLGRRVVGSDPLEFGKNLEDIAKGTAVVQ